MKLRELEPAEGLHRVRNCARRGTSPGNGKTAGRGQKGQKARSDGGVRLGSGGGQTPLFRHLPKHGSTNISRKDYAVVDSDTLDRFEDGTGITPVILKEARIVRNEKAGIKILADGELTGKLTVKAVRFSKSVQETIEAADGSIEVI